MSAAFLTELEKLEGEAREAAEALLKQAIGAGKTRDEIDRALYEETLATLVPNLRARLKLS